MSHKIRISRGNEKLGNTPNLNLPPTLACVQWGGKTPSCFLKCLREGCYARQSWIQWTNVRESWMSNWNFYKSDPTGFFAAIIDNLRRRRAIDYFRWHSGGEIPDPDYFLGIKEVALACPKTRFLTFTKRYGLDLKGCPQNLEVVFSSWPGIEIPRHLLKTRRFAWQQDGTETRMGRRKMGVCKKHCASCRLCWHLGERKVDIAFDKHSGGIASARARSKK